MNKLDQCSLLSAQELAETYGGDALKTAIDLNRKLLDAGDEIGANAVKRLAEVLERIQRDAVGRIIGK